MTLFICYLNDQGQLGFRNSSGPQFATTLGMIQKVSKLNQNQNLLQIPIDYLNKSLSCV